MKTHRSTQLLRYCSGGERSVKCVRLALEMEACKEEQRKEVWFVSWWLRVLEYAKFIVACLLCMANIVCPWKVSTSGRRDSAYHCKTIRTRGRPIEPLRLLWLRGLMVWSGKTDESQRNKFVFKSDDEVQKWVRLWIHQRPTSFYKTRIDRLVSQWDKCINTSDNYFWIKKNPVSLCSGSSVLIWLPLIIEAEHKTRNLISKY